MSSAQYLQPSVGRPAHLSVRLRLTAALAASLGLSAVVVTTAWTSETRLGAPTYWPWLLTGLQVLSLWAAGGARWWGWLLGGSVQIPWIAYALVTEQIGFIPGCAISAVVQAYSFLTARRITAVPATTSPAVPVGEIPLKELCA